MFRGLPGDCPAQTRPNITIDHFFKIVIPYQKWQNQYQFLFRKVSQALIRTIVLVLLGRSIRHAKDQPTIAL